MKIRNFNSKLKTQNSKLTLALDPSLHTTDYALVDGNEKVIHTGIIKTSPKAPEAKRLAELREAESSKLKAQSKIKTVTLSFEP